MRLRHYPARRCLTTWDREEPWIEGRGDHGSIFGAVSAALFNAINRGVDLRLASPGSRYDLGYGQMIVDVRKDLAASGAIRDYSDLRGRTMGLMAFGTTNELIAERALRRGGLALGDVNMV